jgi:hypothetical protein
MLASVRSLFAQVIDYAGLFPPASLSMDEAIDEYLRHLAAPEAWVVTGFICPSSRLAELETARGNRSLELILLSNEPLDSDEIIASIRRARSLEGVHYRGWEGKIPHEAVERKQVATLLQQCEVEAGAHAYLEVPLAGDLRATLPAALDAICEDGRFMAKLRTGGTTADLVPSPQAVSLFLFECAKRSLPLKFTAGLHQATYHFDEAVGTHLFGFLNALLGAMFAFMGIVDNEVDLIALLTDGERSSFTFDDDSVCWRDKRLTADQIRDARSLVRSFGSCSVAEPIEALESLGLWKAEALEVSQDG